MSATGRGNARSRARRVIGYNRLAMARNLLLSAPPGSGKTTALIRAAGTLDQLRLGGFVTREIREAGRRVGFCLLPFCGEPRIMAHRELVSRQRVGAYGVDVEMVDYVADTALGARAAADLFVVDEIGAMECFSTRFVAAVRRLLDDPRPLIATVALRGEGLIAEVKARDDVELRQLTARNRDALPAELSAWARRAVGGREDG